MIKSELAQRLATRHNLPARRTATKVVDGVFEAISLALTRGDRIELRGFGASTLKTKKPRFGRNPRTGASEQLGERRLVYFRANGVIHRLLNTPVSQGGGASPRRIL